MCRARPLRFFGQPPSAGVGTDFRHASKARPVAVKADARAGGLITATSRSEAPKTGAEANPCLGDDGNLLAAQLKSSQLLSSLKEGQACSNSNLLHRLRLEICAVAPLLDSELIRICT